MYKRYCEFRDAKNMKDADVARETGITPSTFSDWKKGKSNPNLDKLLKIAKAIDAPIVYFLTGSYDADKPSYSPILERLWKSLNLQGQEELMRFANILIDSPQYKKDSQPEMVERKEAM